MGTKMINKKNGFTLIEMVVTVLIVGILGTYAVNSYKSSVLKGNRADAKTKLLEVMQREERYFSEKNTYTVTMTDLGYSASPVPSDKGYYSISGSTPAGGLTAGVILTATTQGNQSNDTACMNFILNSNGQKTVSTSSTTCW